MTGPRWLAASRRSYARLALGIAMVALGGACSGDGHDRAACHPSALYVFDSSFSDAGNAFAATGGLAARNPPYADGRFSNGPVAVEQLAAALGVEARASSQGGTNYAFGGARTSARNFFVVPPITSQVASYLATRTPDPDALYVLRVAANDLLALLGGDRSVDLVGTLGALASMVDDLAAGGARHFLFLDLPDLPSFPAGSASIVRSFDEALAEYVRDLDGGLDVHLLSIFDEVEAMKARPTELGLVDVERPCLEVGPPAGCDRRTIDPKADGFLLYDDAHLTTRMHGVIAEAARELLCGGDRVAG